MDWGATVTALAMENGGGVGWWRRSGMGPGERLAKYKLKSVTRELQKPGSTKIPSPVHPSPAVRSAGLAVLSMKRVFYHRINICISQIDVSLGVW
ncbi:hypothetical protein GBA52_021925 [Prunus armeniaca]|nr:hypothetical protein GBA52_021925 [Prunus armeniaca]